MHSGFCWFNAPGYRVKIEEQVCHGHATKFESMFPLDRRRENTPCLMEAPSPAREYSTSLGGSRSSPNFLCTL